MDVDLMGDWGADLSTFGPYIPHGGAGMLPGLYDIQAFHCRVRTVFTNTVPVDAYRGAGRPEAAYVVERLVDAAARKLGMTPDAIRRKNFIAPRAMPYKDRKSTRLNSSHPFPYTTLFRSAAGPLRHPGLPLPRPHRLHQHRAGRRLSRRRAA